MLVFLDESGDCGLKFNAGSSELFICVGVFFEDAFSASACDRGIDEFRARIGKKRSFEFHFTNCSDRIRREFFQAVSTEEFSYHGFVLRKRGLHPGAFKTKQAFYDNVVGWICENARPTMTNAKVVIDECGDREFQNRLSTALKRRMNEEDGTVRIRKVKMEPSHSNNLLQLADMICGAVGREYSKNEGTFRGLIRGRERRIQLWPK